MAHTMPPADDWLGAPITCRSNLANWLNKESHQLQQAGTRYRVNEFIDRRLIDRHCPVTSSSPGNHLRDVTRTRLHSDSADASRNVRFDDVNTPALSQDHPLSYTPTDISCANNHASGVVNHR